MSGSVISMSDFNRSKRILDGEDGDEVDDIDESIAIAEGLADQIVGFCDDCGERLNNLTTVQHLVMLLTSSLHHEADMSREEIVEMLDATTFRDEEES